ncbi:uncharacterized protein VTP21DRAFT_5528 [Calcarisporiella thermophila]|uniref:uncharacterized protein n=1 Tax=Calcarisporiella thermophila TaxID=911321 RepID=UPI003743010A
MSIHRDIAYTPANNPHQTLDLYLGLPSSPLVVYVHGGAWRTGDKSEFQDLGEYLQGKGLTIAIVNYRLSPRSGNGIKHPAHLEDLLAALEFLASHRDVYGYSEELYLIGHSAGAHMALMGYKYVKGVRAVMGIAGIYDIQRMLEKYPSYIDFVEGAFGKREEYFSLSPRSQQPTKDVKYLIVHSPGDELLSMDLSIDYFEHLKENGVNVKFESDVQGGHDEMLHTTEFFQVVVEFVQRSQHQ